MAGRNARDILTASAKEIVLPSPLAAPEGKTLRRDHRLYNNLVSASVSRCSEWLIGKDVLLQQVVQTSLGSCPSVYGILIQVFSWQVCPEGPSQ